MWRFLTVLFFLACRAAGAAEGPGVVVAEAAIQQFPLTVEALGNARANESVDIRPEVVESVSAIRFEEGQRVEAGAVLVELENTEALAAVAAARATLVDSGSQLRRAQELFRSKAVSASEIEQLTARRDADRALLDAAKSRLDDTVVRAPFAGRLGLRRISPGSLVGPDTIITTLDDTDTIKLDFAVPETVLARVQEGLTVSAISAAYLNEQFNGVVSSVDTRVDPVTRTITLRAVVANPDGKLRPGMFLTVTLLKEDVKALTIPEEAVVPEQSRQFVFVVGMDDVVEKREIRTGRRRPGDVEVLEGLSAGERVITEGTQKARPGKPVQVLQRQVSGG
ncbi:MAG: efflux RND transporter periplasmic adaptor subunit [Gammaproteobacteria bacterium]|nr:efflux RND transporter periplasmic adaptor subunit [Gammaproteobacteria bacterium]